MKDTHLKNSTEYNKQSGELQNETKKINFERNTKYNDHVYKTVHVTQQENLARKVAYDKLETDTNYLEYNEELERNTTFEKKKQELNKEKKIYKSDMDMKKSKHGAEIYKRDLALEQKNAELRNETQVN